MKSTNITSVLPAGRYWIGDPCYILTESNGFDWSQILDDTQCLGLFESRDDQLNNKYQPIERQNGYFAIDGRFEHPIFASSTAYGDGEYRDRDGNRYGVDAGLLACIPESLISDHGADNLGHFHDFPDPFNCSYDEGRIKFGHITIDTDEQDDDEGEWN